MLTVQAISKTFHIHAGSSLSIAPLKSLSFSVAQGEFLGVSGPSGIGKSSILKCVYRTYLPDQGHIWFDSQRYGTIDLASSGERQIAQLRRHELGYVSQFLRVIPRVPAVDIVAEKLLAAGYSPEEASERAEEMLDRLAIPKSLWSAYPATFSGGEQQRVNLARALVLRPRLLILDEPTASLDHRTKQRVIGLLQEMKRAGTTMIGVFHDVDMMEQVADRILDLRTASDNGKEGTKDGSL